MMNKDEIPQDAPFHKRKSIRDIPIPEGRRRQNVSTSSDIVRPQVEDMPHGHDTKDSVMHDVRIHRHITSDGGERVIKHVELQSDVQEFEEKPYRQNQPERTHRQKKVKTSKRWIFITPVVAIILFIGVFMTFSGAQVIVYPKMVGASVNTEINAVNKYANTEADSEEMYDITFIIDDISTESSRKVPATGEEEVIQKSSGTIAIFNEYSEEDQRLVKDTRFRSPTGLIYRIPESVLVPGLTRDASGNVIPGSITTEVFADVAGESYNIGPERFTVPGFEGLPQYDGFYAKSDASMTGGFNGVKKIVSESDRNTAERELREEIRNSLLQNVRDASTDDVLVFADESLTTYETLNEKIEGDTVVISMRGNTKAVILDYEHLSNALAQKTIPSFDSATNKVRIANMDDVSIRIFSNSESDDSVEKLRITAQGSANFVWSIDNDALRQALRGTNKNEISTIMNSLNSISRIESKIRPFWKKTFPNNTDTIDVVLESE